MRKKYVLDTSVLIRWPEAILSFGENEVILPEIVLKELGDLGDAEGKKGEIARSAIRLIDQIRRKGNLTEGIELKSGGILREEQNYCNVDLPEDLPDGKANNQVLKICRGLAQSCEGEVILVTKDIFLRVTAQILGIQSEDFKSGQQCRPEGQEHGRTRISMPKHISKGVMPWGSFLKHAGRRGFWQ